jgi:hypothetical protein
MSKTIITIIVEGGLIQDIKIPDKAEVVINVKDYDTDGIDGDRLEHDDNGMFFRSTWT